MGVVPEARLNLVIYFMHNGDVQEAFELMKDIEPSSPQEYILKGVTNLAVGPKSSGTPTCAAHPHAHSAPAITTTASALSISI